MINQQFMEQMNIMKSGTFRLKGRELYEKFGKESDGSTLSIYRVSKDGDVNYSTILRWINESDTIDSVKSDILFGYLVGLGLSVDDVLNMNVKELFEYIPDNGGDAA